MITMLRAPRTASTVLAGLALLLAAAACNKTSSTAPKATQMFINLGQGQIAPAGTAVAIPPSVKVADQAFNGISGVSVTFAVTVGGGSITGANAVTDGSGIATVGSWTLGATKGPNSMTASSTGLAGSPITFNATGN